MNRPAQRQKMAVNAVASCRASHMGERQACRMIGCCRTTMRHEGIRQDDPLLRQRLQELP